MLASADEPRFTWRRPAFASKRRDGGNDSEPGGRAPHRGGRRPPRPRSRSCWGPSRPPSGCAPMGMVYVAADARIGRPVAVHVRRPAFASKRRYGGNGSAPGGRAPHRGGRRPPCRRAGSCWGASRPPSGCAPLGIVDVAADARHRPTSRPAFRPEKAGVCKQTPLREQRQRARRSRPT